MLLMDITQETLPQLFKSTSLCLAPITIYENFKLILLEPIASTKPKVDEINKLNIQTVSSGNTFRLSCLGQAYPKPVYK